MLCRRDKCGHWATPSGTVSSFVGSFAPLPGLLSRGIPVTIELRALPPGRNRHHSWAGVHRVHRETERQREGGRAIHVCVGCGTFWVGFQREEE